MGASEGDRHEEVGALLGLRQDGTVRDVVRVADAAPGHAEGQDGALVHDGAVRADHALAIVRIDGERGDRDGVVLARRFEDVPLRQDMETLQPSRLADVERGREVPGGGELVFAEAEGGILGADFFGDGRVGPQEVQKFEGVLFVRLPDPGAFRFVGRMPRVASAHEPQRDLAMDGVVAVELVAGQWVQVEADSADPGLERATGQLESRRVVVRRLGNRHAVRRVAGEAEPEAESHHMSIARLRRARVRAGDQRKRPARRVESVHLHRRLGVLFSGEGLPVLRAALPADGPGHAGRGHEVALIGPVDETTGRERALRRP